MGTHEPLSTARLRGLLPLRGAARSRRRLLITMITIGCGQGGSDRRRPGPRTHSRRAPERRPPPERRSRLPSSRQPRHGAPALHDDATLEPRTSPVLARVSGVVARLSSKRRRGPCRSGLLQLDDPRRRSVAQAEVELAKQKSIFERRSAASNSRSFRGRFPARQDDYEARSRPSSWPASASYTVFRRPSAHDRAPAGEHRSDGERRNAALRDRHFHPLLPAFTFRPRRWARSRRARRRTWSSTATAAGSAVSSLS